MDFILITDRISGFVEICALLMMIVMLMMMMLMLMMMMLMMMMMRKIRELDKKYNDECGNHKYTFLIQSQIMPFHCLCSICLIFGGEFVSK